jgi:hypothetical protein
VSERRWDALVGWTLIAIGTAYLVAAVALVTA